jgi:hypothetical protein
MYVKLDTLQPFTREQMQALFMDPYVGFPPDADITNAVLKSFGFAVLEYDLIPVVTGLETYVAGALRRDGTRVVQAWTVVAPTAEAVTSQFEQATQAKLDTAAQAQGYDNVSTAISYAAEPSVPKFQNDGIAFRTWRSLVWAYAYEQLALVQSGGREQPTVEAFLLELPLLELPE